MKKRPIANTLSVLCLALAAASPGFSGCSREPEAAPSAIQTRSRHKSVFVSRIPVRLCQWDPLRKAPEDPALRLVKTIVAGDLAGVDALLASGAVGIDDVLCIVEDETIRRRRVDADKFQFLPPTMTSGFGTANKHMLDAYSLTRAQDPSLEKNHVVWLYGTPLMIAARAGNPAMVSLLLARGANPNVFIPTMGIAEQRKQQSPYPPQTVATARPWALLCALTDCYVKTSAKYAENQDDCADLLIRGGAIVPPDNSQGQTALWAAVQVQSRHLVDAFLEAGVDPSRKDRFGMTVSDFILRDLATVSDTAIREAYQTFLSILGSSGNGAAPASPTFQPRPGEGAVPESGPSANLPAPPPRPEMTELERKKQIDLYEGRLVELRQQLADAKHDRDMGALMGQGTASAQMRVYSLMDAIAEAERRLSELQDAAVSR